MAVYVNESGTLKNLNGEYLIIDKYYASTTVYDLATTGSKVRVTAGDGKIYCTWDAVETATRYYVGYKGPGDTDWHDCVGVDTAFTDTEYTITGLENYTQYIVLVQAHINNKWTSSKYCDRVMTKPDVDEQEIPEIPTITIPDVSGYLDGHAYSGKSVQSGSAGTFYFDFKVKIAIVLYGYSTTNGVALVGVACKDLNEYSNASYFTLGNGGNSPTITINNNSSGTTPYSVEVRWPNQTLANGFKYIVLALG